MHLPLQKYKILRQHFMPSSNNTESKIIYSWLQTLLNCDSFFFFGFKSDRGSGSWFSHSAQWGFITTGELWAFPLICLWLAPFNLKFRVKKKFKVSPRTQSTVALIMPHYLIFIFLPVTLSSTDWLIWLATHVKEPRTLTFILLDFKHFSNLLFTSIFHLFDRTAQLIRLTTATPMNCPVLLLNLQICTVIWMKSSWGQVKVVYDKPGRYD